MEKKVFYRLMIKDDFGSDLVEELRHIDRYLSKYINANVDIVKHTRLLNRIPHSTTRASKVGGSAANGNIL